MDLYEYSVTEKNNLDSFVKTNLENIKVKKGTEWI